MSILEAGMVNFSSLSMASQQKQSHKAVVGTPSMNITLLSSPQTALLRTLSDDTCIHPQTMNSSHMLLTRKLCWLIVMTLSNEKNGKSWGQHLLQIGNVLWHRVNWKRVPSQLQATGTILRQQPCKLNPCPSVCYLHVLTKEQGKETRALPKKSCQGFGRLFGKGGLFGRPFFKTNPQELSTLCIYPENSWTTQRMCQSTKYCLSQILPNTFILQLWRNIPLTTMTSIELRLLNTCCITQKVKLRREQSKGHRKGTRAWQNDIQSL